MNGSYEHNIKVNMNEDLPGKQKVLNIRKANVNNSSSSQTKGKNESP
jgi:hypothetical protein